MGELKLSGSQVKLVVFLLEQKEYGLKLDLVREIIRMLPVTRVPGAPPYLAGVINLRGNVIPLVDLHRRLGLGLRVDNDDTRIMVVEDGELQLGLVVDGVSEVLDLHAGMIEPPDQGLDSSRFNYLQGIGKDGERLILLIALDEIIKQDDGPRRY